MKHLKQQASSFLRTLKQSLTDIRFYRGARHKRPAEAAGYLVVLVSFAWIVPFLIYFFVGARETERIALDAIDRHVPAGTIFEMKNGVFTNTLDKPIVARYGDATVIVNSSSSTLTLSATETGFAVMSREIVEHQEPGSSDSASLEKFPDVRISREQISERIRGDAPWVIALVAVLAVAGFALASFVALALTTLFHALVLWLVVRALKKPMPYREAWTLSAYAATPLVLATSLITLLDVDFGGLPTVLYWVMLAFVAYDLWKGAPHVEQPKPEGPEAGNGAGPAGA